MNIPSVIFEENDTFYKDFSQRYITHRQGLFILAPSGSGKTYFCNNQAEQHWIDGDELWMAAHAHPDTAWWKEPIEVINRIDQRSDVITMEAKNLGFWIMGASNYWLKPDAIVIPEWETHVEYIRKREESTYDGGATSEDFTQVKNHIEVIRKWHTDFKVALYTSIDDAVAALTLGQ